MYVRWIACADTVGGHVYRYVVPEGWVTGWHVCTSCDTSVVCSHDEGKCPYPRLIKEAS